MINLDELSEAEIEAIVNTRGFRKMLAYRRLAGGIEVLEDEDQIFESMVTSITKQHSQVRSAGSTREFFRLFRDEVKTFTEGLSYDPADSPQFVDASTAQATLVTDGGRDELAGTSVNSTDREGGKVEEAVCDDCGDVRRIIGEGEPCGKCNGGRYRW